MPSCGHESPARAVVLIALTIGLLLTGTSALAQAPGLNMPLAAAAEKKKKKKKKNGGGGGGAARHYAGWYQHMKIARRLTIRRPLQRRSTGCSSFYT